MTKEMRNPRSRQRGIGMAGLMLVVVLVLVALGLDKRLSLWLQRFALPAAWVAGARARVHGWNGGAKAFGVGLMTPLLPCAPLYAMFGLALFSGSPVRFSQRTDRTSSS